jgi:hypothetical protein
MADLVSIKNNVRKMLTNEFGSIAEDNDGSFFIRNGSTVAFVDVGDWDHDGQNVGYIEVYAFVAVGLKEVNKDLAVELTTDLAHRFGAWRFTKSEGGLWNLLFSAHLIGATVDSAELISAIRLVAIVADEEDDKIVRKYGGSVFAAE